MPRKLRVEYPGAVYHVMSRGNQRQNIFRDCGHLFAGRYKALPVDGSGNGYLRSVCDYVHLNPARAKLPRPGQALESFRSEQLRPISLRTRRASALAASGSGFWRKRDLEDSAAGRREFAGAMQARLLAEDGENHLARGAWFVGGEEFRRELLKQMEERAGPNYYGGEIREMSEAKAERLVSEELKRLGWREKDLKERPKGDAAKVRLARSLREQTTVTLANSLAGTRKTMNEQPRLCHWPQSLEFNAHRQKLPSNLV